MTAPEILKWLERHADEVDVDRINGKCFVTLWPSFNPSLKSVEIKGRSIRQCVERAVDLGCTPPARREKKNKLPKPIALTPDT